MPFCQQTVKKAGRDSSATTRLAASEADLKHGRTYGPFAAHEDMMAFLKEDLAKQRCPAAWGEFDAWIATNGFAPWRHFPQGGPELW